MMYRLGRNLINSNVAFVSVFFFFFFAAESMLMMKTRIALPKRRNLPFCPSPPSLLAYIFQDNHIGNRCDFIVVVVTMERKSSRSILDIVSQVNLSRCGN